MRFGLKTGLNFAYRVWFSRELRECMNVFIISVSNVEERKKICKCEMDFKKIFFVAVLI